MTAGGDGSRTRETGGTALAGVAATEYRDQLQRLVQVDPADVARVAAAAGDPVPRTPATATEPAPVPEGRHWGWQVQLYQLRSADSWGIGDYADLARLATGLAALGADVLLVNPLHAETPVAPFTDSPYYPSSRRAVSLASLSITALPEYQAADPDARAAVDALKPASGGLIDRGEVWRAKLAALDLLFPGEAVVQQLLDGRDDQEALRSFAVFCALAEQHGRSWPAWPADLHEPGAHADATADPRRVTLHTWAQIRAREQLRAAQDAALAAGMTIGIVHDLAVGVDPDGADGWALQSLFASGMRIGAPPDEFNQLGQNWGLPAWRPDRLAETGFAPWRSVVETAFTLGGGLRIDHILGLSRLWYVPQDGDAADGTFVSYDTEAMLGAVVDAARAHGGLVIGEDLGTVDPAFRRRLAELGVLGSAVLWFEGTDVGESRRPVDWRSLAAASVSTHDLPTAHGWLQDEQVRIRERTGVLGRPPADEYRAAAAERQALLDLLVAEGLLDPADTGDADRVVDAMYGALVQSPSRIVLAAPGDAVGDLRQPNLPGTVDQYPNWRLPLADGQGQEVSLEAFLAAPGTRRLSRLLDEGLRRAPRQG
ncbi:MAG: 4-alpha-glucanotransferase [Jatrophihabitans sp.]|uniref:4-alpha-glucanotransferase n=1 Tax=Jatrophihabitans sp. TaxID=1932789 RepID=UPI003F813DD5